MFRQTTDQTNDTEATTEGDDEFDLPQRKSLFADADEMKANLRDQLSKPEYNVTTYYKSHGMAQKIARSQWFEYITMLVITGNALWIFVDTDYNPSDNLATAPIGFQIVEQCFAFYFVFEWVTRFVAFQNKLNGLRDAWFVFDTLLTFMLVTDSWIMYLYMKATGIAGGSALGNASLLRILRLLRLTRMARLVHLIQAMPELGILLRGLGAATRSVSFTLILLLGLLYIFGIAFRLLCSAEEHAFCAEFFSSVPQSMHTLLIHGTFMDSILYFVIPCQQHSPGMLMLFYVFLLLAALTIMNMLIGVLCEVVNTTATIERESVAVNYVKQRLQKIMLKGGMGTVLAGDSRIDKKEFRNILQNQEAAQVLKQVGVDVIGLVDFADFIFKNDILDAEEEDEKMLSFADFVEVVLELRGNNNATVRDIVDLRKYVQLKVENMEKKLDAVAGRSRAPSRMASTSSMSDALKRTKSSPNLARPMRQGGQGFKSETSSFSRDDEAIAIRRARTDPDPHLRGSTSSSDFLPNDQEPKSPRCHSHKLHGGMPDIDLQCARLPSSNGDHGEFRHLVDSLIAEHESVVASMQRRNQRLEVELQLLKSANDNNAVARKSTDDFVVKRKSTVDFSVPPSLEQHSDPGDIRSRRHSDTQTHRQAQGLDDSNGICQDVLQDRSIAEISSPRPPAARVAAIKRAQASELPAAPAQSGFQERIGRSTNIPL